MTDTSTTTTDTVRLTGYGHFSDLDTSILALLFGEMVRRSHDVIREYHSDLFHDAEWLRTNVTGACTFHFMVRSSGTNLGPMALVQRDIGAPGGVLYRVDLRTANGTTTDTDPTGMWVADFTEEWRA